MAKARILAVDDQRYFRELIAGLLEEEGFETQTAASGDEALRALDRANFDVVLTDLVMPVMDGSELVERIKARDPEQEVVVVTGVVDVKSAVDAMKLGATDYILKPLDRATLAKSLEAVLQRTRLRAERDRLLAENIEYMGERSLFERALGLFACETLEAVVETCLEGLSVETGSGHAVIWRPGADPEALEVIGSRGATSHGDVPGRLAESEIPAEIRDGNARSVLVETTQGSAQGSALWLALRSGIELVGVVRLSDKADDEPYDEVDRSCAERFCVFAEQAFSNAARTRELERGSLEDPRTGTYRLDPFLDIAQSEIEKAQRFGRKLALVRLCPTVSQAQRDALGEEGFGRWLRDVADHTARLLRATDLLAVDDGGNLWVLLAESDALGAATFKERTRAALLGSDAFARLDGVQKPGLEATFAAYPGDATRLDALLGVIEFRAEEQRHSGTWVEALEDRPLGEVLESLLERGESVPEPMVSSAVRFALAETGRWRRDQGLLFVAPGGVLLPAVREGLGLRGEPEDGAEIVLLGEVPSGAAGLVSQVPVEQLPGAIPFLVHYGDAPPYAMVCGNKVQDGSLFWFHSADRGLVEYLALRLQRELRVPHLA